MLGAGAVADPLRADSGAQRLGWLDALRGIAVLFVVFEHLSNAALGSVRHLVIGWFSPGLYGVMVFFLVSGYIVPASLERRGSVRKFWISRVFRLYPLFLVAVAVKLVLAGVHLATDTVDDAASSILGHALMLQDLLGVRPMVNVMWTLSYEMAFYVLITAVFVAGAHRANAGLATGFAAASLLLGGTLPQIALSHSPLGVRAVAAVASVAIAAGLAAAGSGRVHVRGAGAAVAGGAVILLLLLNQRVRPWQGLAILAIMLTGTVLYRVDRGQVGQAKGLAAMAAVGVLAVASGLWHIWQRASPSMMTTYQRQWASSVVLAVATFAVVRACRKRNIPWFLCWLGMISYSVYLMHMLLLDVFVRLPWVHGGQAPVITVTLVGSFLALMTGLCWLTYRCVELPTQRLGRRLAAWVDTGSGPGLASVARPAPAAARVQFADSRAAKLAGTGNGAGHWLLAGDGREAGIRDAVAARPGHGEGGQRQDAPRA